MILVHLPALSSSYHRLLGMQIGETPYGAANVQIEEYKRPSLK